MSDPIGCEAFHPGEFICEEMSERGWSMETLVSLTGLGQPLLEEIIAEHRSVTPLIAYGLSQAFGTSSALWINLQKSFDAIRAKRKETE